MNNQIQLEVLITPTGLVSRKHAALGLGLAPKTLAQWSSKGIGPKPIKIGGRTFYRWKDIQEMSEGS